LLDKEDYDNAIQGVQRGYPLDPNYATAYYNRGRAWCGVGYWECPNERYYDKASNDFDRASGSLVRPFGSIPMMRMPTSVAAKRGCARREASQDDEACDKAINDFSEAIRLDPDNACVYVERGKAYAQRYRIWLVGEDYYDNAIKISTRPFDSIQNCGEAYQERGKAWFKKWDCDKAIKDHDEVIRLDPDDAEAYRNRGKAKLGNAYRNRGKGWWLDKTSLTMQNFSKDCDKAIKDFDEAIRLCTTDADFFYERGQVQASKEDFAKAIKELRQGYRAQSETLARLHHARRFACNVPRDKFRDGKRAIQMATKACELTDWKMYWGLEKLAAAYAEAGQFEQAEYHQNKGVGRYELASLHAGVRSP